jgi:hypothetical protein
VILSKHFVFLHLPKTGGSFVRELCTHYAPPAWQVSLLDNHPTVRDIPPEYTHLPIFGFVRNPFDWYVSWYAYLKKRLNDPFFNQVSEGGTKSFRDTMLTVFDTDISGVLGRNCLFTESPFGCYLNYVFGNNLRKIQLGKFEFLREDLLRIWSSMVQLPERLEEQIRLFPEVNKSERGDYRVYYDQQLRRLVERRDRLVLDRFDYRF